MSQITRSRFGSGIRGKTTPYLTLIREDAPRRVHSLRDIFTALRWMARSGSLLTLPAARVPALAGRLLAYRALDRNGPL